MFKVADRVAECVKSLSSLGKVDLVRMDIDPSDPGTGDFKLRVIVKSEVVVDVYERLSSGNLMKYSYSLVSGSKVIIRYDNAPHHKEIETFPHHKHLRTEILPLHSRSLSHFVNEVKELLSKNDILS